MNQQKDTPNENEQQIPGAIVTPGDASPQMSNPMQSANRVRPLGSNKNNKDRDDFGAWLRNVVLLFFMTIGVFAGTVLTVSAPLILYIDIGPPEGLTGTLLIIGIIVGTILPVVIGGRISQKMNLSSARLTIALSMLTYITGVRAVIAGAYKAGEPQPVLQESLAIIAVILFMVLIWFGYHYLARIRKINILTVISILLMLIGASISLLSISYISEQSSGISQNSRAQDDLSRTLDTDYQLYFPSDVSSLKLYGYGIEGTTEVIKHVYKIDDKRGEFYIVQAENSQSLLDTFECLSCEETLTTDKGLTVYTSYLNNRPKSLLFTLNETHIKLTSLSFNSTPSEIKDEKWISDFVNSFRSYSDKELDQLF